MFYDEVDAALPILAVQRSRRQGRNQEPCAFHVPVTKSPVPFMFFENWILEACGLFGSLEPEQ